MTKRILLFSAAALILLWWGALLVSEHAIRRVTDEPWPLGLGTLNDVPKRFPLRATSDAALSLSDAARPFGSSLVPRTEADEPPRRVAMPMRKALDDYVAAQLSREDDGIDPPSPAVAVFLAERGTSLDAVRRELIANPDAVEWIQRIDLLRGAPLPNLLGHMDLARSLAADALVRQRAGDPVAWDDAHAMLNLARPLLRRPEIISQLIAAAIVRMANGVARKLSPPEPPWRREIDAIDFRRSLIAALQAETWRMMREIEDARVPDVLGAPYTRFCLADLVEHYRGAAAQIASSNACGVDPRTAVASFPRWNVIGRTSMPNMGLIRLRMGRFNAEREAVSKILALKERHWPDSAPDIAASRCTDGKWVYTRTADSKTLTFTNEAALRGVKAIVPLTLRYAVP